MKICYTSLIYTGTGRLINYSYLKINIRIDRERLMCSEKKSTHYVMLTIANFSGKEVSFMEPADSCRYICMHVGYVVRIFIGIIVSM